MKTNIEPPYVIGVKISKKNLKNDKEGETLTSKQTRKPNRKAVNVAISLLFFSLLHSFVVWVVLLMRWSVRKDNLKWDFFPLYFFFFRSTDNGETLDWLFFKPHRCHHRAGRHLSGSCRDLRRILSLEYLSLIGYLILYLCFVKIFNCTALRWEWGRYQIKF